MIKQDTDDHHLEEVRLTPRELDEIRDEVDRGGDHAWGFRLEAAIKAAKLSKLRHEKSQGLGKNENLRERALLSFQRSRIFYF